MSMGKFENIREQILELLSKDQEAKDEVEAQIDFRFDVQTNHLPRYIRDEIVCLIRLRVYKEILDGVA